MSSHRRSHSESFLALPDDLSFFDFSLAEIDFDEDNDNASAFPPPPAEGQRGGRGVHARSLSVDDAMLEDLVFGGDERGSGAVEKKGDYGHRRSGSVEGTTMGLEGVDWVKKATTPEQLRELSLVDPKRAKRILANRQSAARSKERKVRYTSELEMKVQTLQTEATTLSTRVTLLQKDTTHLTAENKELKLRLQALEQQAPLRDALNETLREEVQRLKIAAGQIQATKVNTFNREIQQQPSPFPCHPQQLHDFNANMPVQFLASRSTSNSQPFLGHSSADSMDYI